MVTFPSSVARYAGREFILPASAISSQIKTSRMKYWEIIADNLSKAGWTWGYLNPSRKILIANHQSKCPVTLFLQPAARIYAIPLV
jgi:hypothetical protein